MFITVSKKSGTEQYNKEIETVIASAQRQIKELQKKR